MVKVCDCFPELKDITDARERRYRSHPDKPAPEGPRSFVEVKVTSIGQLNELVAALTQQVNILLRPRDGVAQRAQVVLHMDG